MTQDRGTEGDAIAIVRGHYELESPRILSMLEASNRNENFLVEDGRGGLYVLRRYRRNQEKRRVGFQLRFQRHLFQRGFPTAEIVESKSGELQVSAMETPWALFCLVNGQEYRFDHPAQVLEAGRRLAEFHSVAATFEEQEVVVDWDRPIRQFWAEIDTEAAALRDLFQDRGVDELVEEVCQSLANAKRRLPIERFDALPMGWIHGDYHGRNVLFDVDRMVGLFDFDVTARGPLALDVASGLFMFGRERRGSRRVRLEAARSFVNGYEETRVLSQEEMAAIPAFLCILQAPDSGYFRYRERDGDDIVEMLRHSAGYMRDLDEESRRLARELGWPE